MDFLNKLRLIMNKRQKTSAVILFIIMLVNSALELLGIAMVSPVVNVLQAQTLEKEIDFASKVNENLFSKYVCKIFGINPVPNNASIIITAMILIIVFVYLIKAFFSVFVTYVSTLYSRSLSRSVSSRLIKSNLSMPYDYFVSTNSAIIMRKCTSDVEAFTSSISGVINTLISGFIAGAIFVYLMIKSWKITLAFTAFMIIASLLSIFLLKNKARKLGREMQRFNARNVDILHKSIYGIKETKISETDAFFSNEYYKNKVASDKNCIKYALVSSLPSQIIQNFGIIVVMFVTMILVIIMPKEKSAFIVTLLTAFVLAAVKLLPNINVISGNAVAFSYFKPSVFTIFKDLEEAKEIENQKQLKLKKYGTKPFIFNKRITIKNLSFAYIQSTTILDNVNLEINKGEYVAFSGNSGAGKTTLVDNLLGLLTPQKGDIICDDRSIYQNIKSWHSLLSYVPQNIFLLDDTVKANVCFGLRLEDIDENKVWKALEKAQLKEFVETLPKKLETRVGEAGVKLSGGQRQRIGIARAFYRDTPIMVLDEATSALDYKTEDNILLNIRKVKGDKTVIIITHRLNTISHCDKIYSIENHLCKQIK